MIMLASYFAMSCVYTVVLASILFVSRNKSILEKIIAFFFVFYSIAPLVSYNLEFFTYLYVSEISLTRIFTYFVTAVFFLFAIHFCRLGNQSWRFASNGSMNFSQKLIFIIMASLFLSELEVLLGYLTLSKSEAIFQIQNRDSLIGINLPASAIVAGVVLYNPFSSRVVRAVAYAIGLVAILFSLLLGYRFLMLIIILSYCFRRSRGFGGLLFAVFALSVIGDFSNVVKIFMREIFTNNSFDPLTYLLWSLQNTEFRGLSSEQAAIGANFHIGLILSESINDFVGLVRLIPFTSSIFDYSNSGAINIGEFVGVGDGQGTGYNYQLFVLKTYFFGLGFIVLFFQIFKLNKNTILGVYTVEIFFSMMRNDPTFWSSQMKILIFFTILVHFVAFIVSNLPRKHPVSSLNYGME